MQQFNFSSILPVNFLRYLVAGFFLITSVLIKAQPADTLIQTAHQTFNSRIYLMDGQGNTLEYFDYENYRLVDMTIADDELYVADAFGPVVLKVDITDGSLEQFIIELPHTAYYGLAYDSNYFYVEDFGTLYRYDEQGEQQSSASFGETIFGMAWDGQYLYTVIEDDEQIRCWDLSDWPELSEVEQNAIARPSDACRGLFFDGTYFWTSEALETVPGNSYRMNHDGEIIESFDNASHIGWGIAAKLDTTATAISHFHRDKTVECYFNAKTNQLNLFLPELPAGNIHLEVHAVTGQLMRSEKISYNKTGKIEIPLPGLNSGVYIVSVNTASGVGSTKFFVP